MDKYIGDIITEQREDTRNTDLESIPESRLLRYNQYAQDRLYGLVTLSFNWAFETSTLINLEAGKEEYTVNDNLAFGMRISNVEYSPQANDKFYPIPITPDRYTQLITSGRPRFYKRRHGSILIEPIPDTTQGVLRITYERALDKLALRAGRINGTPSGATINLNHSSYGSPTTENEALFIPDTYICISDAYGEPLLYNAVIQSYNSGTDVLTLTSNVENFLVSNKTLADLANGYLTLGKYTTTHSKLPNEAENFFIEWVNRKLHNVDDSDQFDETDMLLQEIANTIVASFKFPDKARKRFPIYDFDLLIPEYE